MLVNIRFMSVRGRKEPGMLTGQVKWLKIKSVINRYV